MGIHPRYFGIDQRLKHGGNISHYVEMYHPDKSFLGHTQVIKVGDLGKVSAIESMHPRSALIAFCGMLPGSVYSLGSRGLRLRSWDPTDHVW